MTAAIPEIPATHSEQIALLRNSGRWRTLLGYLGLVYLVTPFVLGFIFLMMLLPLTLAFARLAMIYTPAYRLMGRMLNVHPLPDHLARPSAFFMGYSIIYILFWLVIAAICARLLLYASFCDQNLICLTATKLWFERPLLQ